MEYEGQIFTLLLKRMVDEADLDRLGYLSMAVKQSSLDSKLTVSAFAISIDFENSKDWTSKSLTATSASKRSLGDSKKVLTMMPKHFQFYYKFSSLSKASPSYLAKLQWDEVRNIINN